MSKKLNNNYKLQDDNFINDMFTSIKKEYNNNSKIYTYLNKLDNNEIKALVISKVMLESSFSIEKCIGFLSYNKE